jgi:hypothetical protein
MSLHQKRVTITAVDLSGIRERDCCVVIAYEDERPSEYDILMLRKVIAPMIPNQFSVNTYPVICLKKGQTLTVEQLPKQPRQRRKRRHDDA